MTHSERWQRTQGLVLLLVIAVLAVAALLGGRAIGATVDARGATATASGAKSVDISHFAFHPPALHVKRGGKVTWTNSQNVTHTATGAGFDKTISPGNSVTIKFSRRGTFAYHCKIHPFMKGKIVVE